MPSVNKLTLSFDNGTTQDIQVGPQQTTIQTPFGQVELGVIKPKAPTGAEFAANPGKYANTSFDRTLASIPSLWDDGVNEPWHLTTYMNWADWYKSNPTLAIQYLKENLKADLNFSNLDPSQKQRMGIQ